MRWQELMGGALKINSLRDDFGVRVVPSYPAVSLLESILLPDFVVAVIAS
jgi:hypothetical protein